jgi:transposase
MASQIPDEIKEHKIKNCPKCGGNVEQVQGHFTKTQVFEIPEIRVKITEHHIHEIQCPYCHAICRPCIPKEITAPVQYGPRFKSLLLYLHTYHFVSAQRVQEFCQDVFGHRISQACLFEAEKLAVKNLQSFERILKEKLKTSFVLHADETALRVNKQIFWLHVASTKDTTLFFAHPRRSYQAMVEMGVLPSFRGVLVHDHYAPYFKFDCQHALCHAHHLRELEHVFEMTKLKWAKDMKELLQEMNKSEDRQLKQKEFEAKYEAILEKGFKEYEKTGPPIQWSQSLARNLLNRLKNFKTESLRFLENKHIPFDNNLAERDLRMMKLKMKVSGCFRSTYFAKIFCLLRSLISTARKRRFNILKAIEQAFIGNPLSIFLPNS